MTQTPLDLEREEEWGGEKRTRGEDKEDKEVGEEDKDWVPNWKAKDEPFGFLQCKWQRQKLRRSNQQMFIFARKIALMTDLKTAAN